MNPPNVLFFLLMRYHNPLQKLHNYVNPSTNINFHGSTYKLKSIVQHNGETQRQGHYTTMLYLDNKWVECNDTQINLNKNPNAEQGYIYVYELTTDSTPMSTISSIKETAHKGSRLVQNNKHDNTPEIENDIQTIKRKTNDKDDTNVSKKLKNKKVKTKSFNLDNEPHSYKDNNKKNTKKKSFRT